VSYPTTYWCSTASTDLSQVGNWTNGLPSGSVRGVIDANHGATVWPATGTLTGVYNFQLSGGYINGGTFGIGDNGSLVATGGTINGGRVTGNGYVRLGAVVVNALTLDLATTLCLYVEGSTVIKTISLNDGTTWLRSALSPLRVRNALVAS
jgi:hypothetical protein